MQSCHSAVLICAALLLTACALTQRQPYVSPVWGRPDLEGGTLATVFEQCGKRTVYDHTRPANQLGGEFYRPINALFPPDDPASRKMLIREVRWLRDDRYLAVFCTRQSGVWRVFDTISWPTNVVF